MFAELKKECIRSFSFLLTEFGYRIDRANSSNRGFCVRFAGPTVGVEVAYQMRDPLTVMLVILDHGDFQPSAGEVTPTSPIEQFDLRDIEIATGTTPADELSTFSIPTAIILGEYAGRLRASAGGLLAGDLTEIPSLRRRVLDRARRTAFDKWGPEATNLGW